MYKKQNALNIDGTTGDLIGIIRLSDGAFIPINNANTDYQEYLEWVADGGVVEPADE